MPSTGSFTRPLADAFRAPVSADTRERLHAAWACVPERFRVPNQFLGRQYAGCGATIGVEPRCDFACRGCYLGAEANRVPRAPLPEVKRQLRRIRCWLGEGGNVQLTDGEVTLLPPPATSVSSSASSGCRSASAWCRCAR